MIKIQIITLLISLLLINVNCQDASPMEMCQGQCFISASCDFEDENNVCMTSIMSMFEKLMQFEYAGCTDFLYKSASETATVQQKNDAYITCLSEHSAALSGAQQTFFSCYRDCHSNNDFNTEDIDMDMTEGQVCMIESIQTSTNCKMGSTCFEENIREGIAQKELVANYDISECDEQYGSEHNSELTAAEFSLLVKNCYEQLSIKATQANNESAGTYPDDLITYFDSMAVCADSYELDFRNHGQGGQSEDEEDEDPMNCKTSYCIPEFEKCNAECEKQCGENMTCLGDSLNYLSFISTQECKDYLLENANYYKLYQSVDDDFITKFEACGDALVAEHSGNAGVQTLITCLKGCKTEPVKGGQKEEEEESSQILNLSLGILMILALII